MELSDGAFTVLITDDDRDGQTLKKLSDEWRSRGLLNEFAIVTPSSVRVPDQGPATITASIIGQDVDVELMRHLGSRRRSLIRLVVLHLLTHADSSADALVRVCDQ